MKLSCLRLVLCVLFPVVVFGDEPPVSSHRWPDAPPAVLREELFGIRFRLVLQDRGAAKAAEFLNQEMARRPSAPEVQAYVAWVSLFPNGWGLGELVPRDSCEALLRVAARGGSSVAKDVLGYALVDGRIGIAENREEGLRLLREAAAAGCARSIGRLARMQLEGWHVPRQPLEGALGLRRALALGSTTDLADLAEAYEKGQGGGMPAGSQASMALEYYYLLALDNDGRAWNRLKELAAASAPGAKLLHSLAFVRYANEGGFLMPSAVRKHLAIVEELGQADARACVELGVAKLFGHWGKRAPAAAKELFLRAQRSGNQEAKFFLAYMRLRGLAGPEEKAPALAEMTALAEAGSARAHTWLGYIYYWGAAEAGSLKKDPALAFHHTRRAAELGSRWAAVNLAHCYKHGIGTAENPVLAAKMYWLALNYGVMSAKEDLQRQLAFAKLP